MQIYYFVGRYGRIAKYSNSRRPAKEAPGVGISVIVLLGDNLWYLENVLPKFLAQDYPDFEIVIVEIGTTEEFSDELAILRDQFTNIITTRMEYDPRFPLSNKMAYNVGIKAATKENIILTTDSAGPVSPKWLDCMSRGFETGDVVVGYCGMERKAGLVAKMMRCDRLMPSTRSLASAVAGEPYRGTIHNLGLSRELYFRRKGFGHLNMNLGEDDLFVQQITTAENCSIIMNPHATMREIQWGGAGWWWGLKKFRHSTFRYYPRWVKNYIQWELGSRLLFYAAVITLAVIMPWQVAAGVGALWLLRLLIVRYQMWRVRKRLGERSLGWALVVHDIIEPLSSIWLAMWSRLRPAAGVWR